MDLHRKNAFRQNEEELEKEISGDDNGKMGPNIGGGKRDKNKAKNVNKRENPTNPYNRESET